MKDINTTADLIPGTIFKCSWGGMSDYYVAGARNKNEYIRSVAQRKFAHHECTHIKQKFKYYRTLLETWERMNPTQCLHKGSLHHTQCAND